MRELILCLFLSLFSICHSKEVTDTVRSSYKDEVRITYDITLQGSTVSVRFKNVYKTLGTTSRREYSDLSDIAVIFFDRRGNFENYKFEGLTPVPISKPSHLIYEPSSDGYFILRSDQMPTLAFEIKAQLEGNILVEVPLYLAYYREKRRFQKLSTFQVFRRLDNLKLKLPKEKPISVGNVMTESSTTQTIVSTEELGDGLSDKEAQALELVNDVIRLSSLQNKLPMDEELTNDFKNLNDLKFEIKDSRIKEKIEKALEAYRLKKQELEAQEEISLQNEQRLANEKALEAASQAKAEQDSIMKQQQTESENQRKRNLWMIIGGVFLALIAFVGSQIFEKRRNKALFDNAAEMQNNLVKQAEREAKRRARDVARSAAYNAKREATRKSQELLSGKVSKTNKSSFKI